MEKDEVDGDTSKSASSCTIEETNRLRASLGLKPLTVENDKPKEPEIEDPEKLSEEDFLQRIAASRAKREYETFSKGKSIAESLEDDDLLDPIAWVSRMRKQDKEKIVLALQGKTCNSNAYTDSVDDSIEEEALGSKSSSKKKRKHEPTGPSLHVVHDRQHFLDGEDTILTLADKRIINAEGELDDETDELENVALREKERLDKKLKDKTITTVYDPTQDWEVGPDGIPRKRDILEHYDEWSGVKKTVKGFIIKDVVQDTDIAPEKKLEILSRQAENLETPLRVQSDYFQPKDRKEERAVNFQKSTKRKEPSLKKPDKLAWQDVFGDEAIEQSSNIEADHGSRLSRKDMSTDDQAEYMYEQLDKQRKLHQSGALITMKNRLESVVDNFTKEKTDIKQEIKEEKPELPDEKEQDTLDDLQITSTTEFCRTVQTPGEKLESMKSESFGSGISNKQHKFSRHRKHEHAQNNSESASASTSGPVEVNDETMELSSNASGESEDEACEAASALIHQQLMDGGISSALQLFQSRGDLTSDLTRRIRGSTDGDPLHKTSDPKDVKLDYRDNFGRVMTPKEAFRYISWIFHGKKPGKKKQEKLLKKMEMEKKLKSSDPMSIMPTMKALSKVQKKEGQAFMVLNGQGEK